MKNSSLYELQFRTEEDPEGQTDRPRLNLRPRMSRLQIAKLGDSVFNHDAEAFHLLRGVTRGAESITNLAG